MAMLLSEEMEAGPLRDIVSCEVGEGTVNEVLLCGHVITWYYGGDVRFARAKQRRRCRRCADEHAAALSMKVGHVC
jgi:hypothetical protein